VLAGLLADGSALGMFVSSEASVTAIGTRRPGAPEGRGLGRLRV